MDERIKARVAFALKCKKEDVPEDPKKLAEALSERRKKLKADKEAKRDRIDKPIL